MILLCATKFSLQTKTMDRIIPPRLHRIQYPRISTRRRCGVVGVHLNGIVRIVGITRRRESRHINSDSVSFI